MQNDEFRLSAPLPARCVKSGNGNEMKEISWD